MVGPAVKREGVAHLRAAMGLSERRACSIVSADRKMVRYRSRRPPDTELRTQLRDLRAGGAVCSVKACGSVTAQVYTLIQVYLEPRGSMPSHRHAAFEEGIYVLDGSIQATLDGETYEATAGSFLVIPWAAASDPECGGKPRSAIAAERSWRGRGLLSRRMQAVPRWSLAGQPRDGLGAAPHGRPPFRDL